jgi:hypothetical protein
MIQNFYSVSITFYSLLYVGLMKKSSLDQRPIYWKGRESNKKKSKPFLGKSMPRSQYLCWKYVFIRLFSSGSAAGLSTKELFSLP